MPDELLALEVADGDTELLCASIAKLVRLRILSDGGADGLTFLHFAERQVDYPSELPEAVAQRVRRHRTGGDVTSGNEVKRIVTSRNDQEEKRKEEKRREKKRVVDVAPRRRVLTVEEVLQDTAWVAKQKALRPLIPWDSCLADGQTTHFGYLVEQWREGLQTTPAKNLKLSLGNWMDHYRAPGERNGTNRGHPQAPQKPSKFDGFGITVEA